MTAIETRTQIPSVAQSSAPVQFTPVDFAKNAEVMKQNIEKTAKIAEALDAGKTVLWKNGELAGQTVDYKRCWDNYVGTYEKFKAIGEHRLQHGVLDPKSLDESWMRLGGLLDQTAEKVFKVAVDKGIQPKPQAEIAPAQVDAEPTASNTRSTLKTAAKFGAAAAILGGSTYTGYQYSDYLGETVSGGVDSITSLVAKFFKTNPEYYDYASTGLGSADYMSALVDQFNDLSGLSQAGVATAGVVGLGLAAVGTYKYGKRVLNAVATPFIAVKNYFRPQQPAVQTA